MGLPNVDDFLNRNAKVNTDVAGVDTGPMDGPDPADYKRTPYNTDNVLPQPPLNSTGAIQDSIASLRNFHQGAVIDPYQLGKEQLFGAGLSHHQFERYYEHPKFNKLGFTPFRDNETFYNEHSSGWNDFSRATGEWWTLLGLGLKDASGFGDLTDIENARTYERAMAIGSSSRDGFASFTTNLFLNSGYTAGIIGEIALEELGLALVAPLTGGASIAVGVARGARAFSKVKHALNMGSNIVKSLNNLKDINKARQFMKNATVSAGRLVNPLEQSTDFIRNYKKLDNLTRLAKTSAGVGAFYRDIRNLRLVWSESGLEGGMVQNQMERELLASHYEKHGRPPTDEEAQLMRSTADKAGMSTALWNMPTIFLSNKIVFNTMFKSFNPTRRLTTDVVTSGTAGKIVKTGRKVSPFEFIEKNFKGFVKGLKNPKAYARTGLNYFKANFAEGFQETAQEVISGSVMDYYKANYGSDIRGGAWSHIGENIDKQMSPEGLEIFMSGFLMGGMIQPATRIPGYIKNGFSRVKDSAGYKKMRAERAEHVNKTVNTLNEMYDDPAKYLAPDMENLVAQNQYQRAMSDASDNGDAKSYYDLKDASNFQHVMTALELGRFDGFVERLESLRELNEEEAREAFPSIENHGDFINSIDQAVERARNIEKRYNAMTKKHPNPFNPSQHKYNSPEYQEEYFNYLGYQKAMQDSIFMQYSFDRTLERMNSLQTEIKADSKLEKVPASDFSALFTIADTQNEINQLKKEVSALGDEQLTQEARKLHTQKKRKLELLENFKRDMDAYLSVGQSLSPEQIAEANQIAEDAGSRPIEVEIKSEVKTQKKLYKSYNQYMKHIAKVSNEHAFDVNLDNSFQKLLDFYNLDDDAVKLTDSVNTLTDPGAFTRHAQRIAEVMQAEYNDRKAKIEQQLEAYLDIRDKNELLITLHKEGMFFDPEQLDALVEKGELPDTFYYAESKGDNRDRLDEVLEISDDYAKALDIVSNFVEHVLNKPIPQRTPNPYDGFIRNRINGDNRTYEDYAEQFGFDPAANQSVVPLIEVLNVIKKSGYATSREKALAERLLSIARDTETVTFKKNMDVPGIYDETTQTSVDARYGATDYQKGDLPLEPNILHQEIHRRTVESLAKDSKFKEDIQKLYDHVKATLETPEYKDKFVTPPVGLASLEEFVAESMTNDQFQRFLAEISYEETKGATTWAGFIDSVVRMLQRFFGKATANTALNGAINIITTEVEEQFGTKAAPKKRKKAHAGQAKVAPSEVMPYITGENLQPTEIELQQDLLKAYRDFNVGRSERGEPLSDPQYSLKTDEDLLADNRFQAYVTSGIFSGVNKALKKYNENTGRTKTTEFVSETTGKVGVPAFITQRMRAVLRDELGYTKVEIGKMTPSQAHEIINTGISKEQLAAAENEAIVAQRVATESLQESVRAEIQTLLNSIETIDDVQIATNKILAIVSDPASFEAAGYTTEEIQAMLNAKVEDIAFSVEFDQLAEGQVVIMNDKFNTRMIIEKKTAKQVKLHKLNDVTFRRTVNAAKVNEDIKYRYNKAMEEVGIAPEEVSTKENKLSNDDVQTAQSLNNQESIQQDIDQAKKKTEQELDDEFLNDIAKCEK